MAFFKRLTTWQVTIRFADGREVNRIIQAPDAATAKADVLRVINKPVKKVTVIGG